MTSKHEGKCNEFNGQGKEYKQENKQTRVKGRKQRIDSSEGLTKFSIIRNRKRSLNYARCWIVQWVQWPLKPIEISKGKTGSDSLTNKQSLLQVFGQLPNRYRVFKTDPDTIFLSCTQTFHLFMLFLTLSASCVCDVPNTTTRKLLRAP